LSSGTAGEIGPLMEAKVLKLSVSLRAKLMTDMKRTLTLIAFVAICSAMIVSCGNNKKTQEPTSEEIQAQKQALADSVLAEIDAFADEYIYAANQSFKIQYFELTEEEKLTKPDYLLEPSYASQLVSKSQKATALAYYSVDRLVRVIYDMPTNEIDEVMAKLIAELNHPWGEYKKKDVPVSELMKQAYLTCKENGDLAYFWQFQNAIIVETSYIIAQNPELFFSKITEEQWNNYRTRYASSYNAISKLSKYDDEMAALLDLTLQYKVAASVEESKSSNATIESAKQFRTANKDKYIAKRNALLQ